MKFIKELIATKNWNGGSQHPLDRESVEHDLLDGGFDSPLVGRKAQAEPVGEDDWPEGDEVAAAESEPEAAAREGVVDGHSPVADLDAAEDDDASDLPEIASDDDDEPEQWDIGLSADALPEPAASLPRDEPFEEPDLPQQSIDLGELDHAEPVPDPIEAEPARPVQVDLSDMDFDDDGIEDELDFDDADPVQVEAAALEALETESGLSDGEKEALVDEIRNAIQAVRHIRSDAELDRISTARDILAEDAGRAGRIFEETDMILNEDVGARRRKAIALMKAAAAATRSDAQLQDMVGRDPTADPNEQRDYRIDLEQAGMTRLKPARTRPVAVADAEPAARNDPGKSRAGDDAKAARPENDRSAADREAEVMSKWVSTEEEAEDPPADEGEPASKSTTALRTALLKATAENIDNDGPAEGDDDGSDWDAWTRDGEDDVEPDAPADATQEAEPGVQVPTPALGRAGRGAGRVKTRLLGFQQTQGGPDEIFTADAVTGPGGSVLFPVGWLVVTGGPGRGQSFALSMGVSQIGRGEDQTVRLDFGDTAISRQNHAAIAFDDEQNCFYLGHGGKSNLVRLNGKPVLATEELHSHDEIRLGETRMMFIALCGREFSWAGSQGERQGHAAIA